MTDITYEIVEHDGGWAYKLRDVFSETFPTHEAAPRAARLAADEQQRPGTTEGVSCQDRQGDWHEEVARGDDRPETHVSD
jgi:hypothetical protein